MDERRLNSFQEVHHPLVSSVLYLSEAEAGPTLVTDQRLRGHLRDSSRVTGIANRQDKRTKKRKVCELKIGADFQSSLEDEKAYAATRGWLCPAAANRLLLFDGSLLHGVVPGKLKEKPFTHPASEALAVQHEKKKLTAGGERRITLMVRCRYAWRHMRSFDCV
jgi:hypothetical protein